ncbi:MAG TPA: GYD domain-containing protein [Gaiellaceae bacterium]|jgi:uncharacterized protein with GYD domain|nr:GYD domain-containing protein [Gaiellaceae bacterium]
MPSYITLINWTDQGAKNYKDSVDRYEAAQKVMSAAGVSFKEIYWTIGPYDLVGVVEAPDDETATAALLTVAGQGNIRTTTLRAFSAGEMRGVIAKAG